MRFSSLLAVACLSWAILCGAGNIVQTEYGPVEGQSTNTTKRWLGMRFTAPPVGSLRWQPPQAPTPWDTPQDASKFGPTCPQPVSNTPGLTQSEDCLWMNIYAPLHSSSTSNLPVYFYIYGGMNTNGFPDKFEGSYLAGEDLVVVVASYRLGALGFLTHPALKTLNPEHTTGNYGIQDQRFALQWVQRNIANFGGNPNNVTLGGTSAGGGAVCSHFVNPKAVGLFNKIIVESGFCVNEFLTASAGASTSNAIIAGVGCNQSDQQALLACLYATSPDTLVAHTTSISPTVDDSELLQEPNFYISAGQYTPMPFIMGNQANESSASFCGPTQSNWTAAQFVAQVEATYPAQAAQILEVYQLSEYPTPTSDFIAVASDKGFVCNSKSWEDIYSNQSNPIWVYRFDRAPAVPPPGGNRDCLGASHTYNVGFLFPSHYLSRTNNLGVLTPEEQVLANSIRAAYVHFIYHGFPVLPDGLEWPQYNFETGQFAIFDLSIKIGVHEKVIECPVWGFPSPSVACEQSMTFSQTLQNSWVAGDGETYSQWSVSVSTTSLPLYSAEIQILVPPNPNISIVSFWGVTRDARGHYELQDWRLLSGQAFPPYTTYNFGYITNQAGSAVVASGLATCVAPPKDCHVSASQNVQSTYYDGTNYFAVYNFVFTNLGDANTNTLQIQLNLPAGSYPTSSWNLATSQTTAEIISSGSVVYTASLYNIAPGQSSFSSGYILASPTPILAAPTFSILSYGCL